MASFDSYDNAGWMDSSQLPRFPASIASEPLLLLARILPLWTENSVFLYPVVPVLVNTIYGTNSSSTSNPIKNSQNNFFFIVRKQFTSSSAETSSSNIYFVVFPPMFAEPHKKAILSAQLHTIFYLPTRTFFCMPFWPQKNQKSPNSDYSSAVFSVV